LTVNPELMLCARNVTFRYPSRRGKVLAVASLSCQLVAGRVTAILGPSGSGKSTLGLLLAGLLEPDSGTVSFSDGRQSSPEDVAYLFQFPEHLFSEDTVERELRQAKTVTFHSAVRALESVGLDSGRFLDRSPFDLSGGEARLVAIAVQLARPSQSVIFDEPTAGLDWNMRARIRNLIRTQAEAGKIVALITHSLSFAASVSDFALVLNGGHAVWDGDPTLLVKDGALCRDLGL
jgi:energy-coupling factor transporter ATP-binding protein EcfA2